MRNRSNNLVKTIRSFELFIFAVTLAFVSLISNARGASVVTATITVTNTAGVGTNWIVNSVTRTWTNAAGTPPSSWITQGANVGAAASNLYSHIIRYPYLSPYLIPAFSSTNVIVLRGSSISITTNNYFSVTYQTNTGTNLSVVQVPFPNVVGDTNRSNNAHWIVDGLNDYARTNRFNTNSPIITNLLVKGAQPYQEILGPVGFWGRFAVLSNFFATNGFTRNLTNIDSKSSNHVNYGNAIRSEGTGGNSLQVGSNALASATLSIAVGNNAAASAASSTAIGIGAIASGISSIAAGESALASNLNASAFGAASIAGGESATALGKEATATGLESVSVGYASVASGDLSIVVGAGAGSAYQSISIGAAAGATAVGAIAIGTGTGASHSNSIAIGGADHAGNYTTTTTTNQFRIATANHTVSIPGQLIISGSQSNTTFKGTNIAGGSWSYPRADITSIANGNNIAVPIGTNRFVRLSGTVTASPAICGLVGAATTGGTDGQDVRVFNDLGYVATFTQNTSDPVAANRIETYDGADVNVANNGWVDLVYTASDSRWHVVNYYPTIATGTNGIADIWTNGVPVTSAGTNLNLIEGEGITLLATNASGLASVQVKNNGSISNVLYLLSTQLVATNTTVNSNLTVNYNIGAVDLFITNNISLTNQTGLAANTSKSTVLFIQPQLVNRTVVYPTLGGASFSQRWFTNANSPMWTTLTGGVTYALSLTSRGTNVHAAISEWK